MKRMMLGLAALVMILAPLAGVCGHRDLVGTEARADSSDLAEKVAKLPTSGYENKIYILNNLDDEVITINLYDYEDEVGTYHCSSGNEYLGTDWPEGFTVMCVDDLAELETSAIFYQDQGSPISQGKYQPVVLSSAHNRGLFGLGASNDSLFYRMYLDVTSDYPMMKSNIATLSYGDHDSFYPGIISVNMEKYGNEVVDYQSNLGLNAVLAGRMVPRTTATIPARPAEPEDYCEILELPKVKYRNLTSSSYFNWLYGKVNAELWLGSDSYPIEDHCGEGFRSFTYASAANYTSARYIYLEYETKYCDITFSYYDSLGRKVETVVPTAVGSLPVPPTLPEAPYATFSKWDSIFVNCQEPVTYNAVYTYTKFKIDYYNKGGTIYRTETKTYYDKLIDYKLPDYVEEKDGKIYRYFHTAWSLTPDDSSGEIDVTSYRANKDLSFYPIYTLYTITDSETGDLDYSKPAEDNKDQLEERNKPLVEQFFNSLGSLLRGDLDEVNWIVLIGGMVILAVLGPIVLPLLVSLVQMIIRGIQQLVSGISRKVSQRRKK